MRPDYPTIVYSEILRRLYPEVPIVAGGIEASMRRLSHYDYWQDRLRPSIITDAPVDMIIYGMGEKAVLEIARHLASGEKYRLSPTFRRRWSGLRAATSPPPTPVTSYSLHTSNVCATSVCRPPISNT